jgi:hypothetical protein
LQKMSSFMFCKSKLMFFQQPSLQFFYRQVDIVYNVDGICTLVDVIIVDIIWANLLSQAIFFCGAATSLVAQMKEGFYYDHYQVNVFLPLAIEVLGCFHQKVDNFLHWCANMVWIAKSTKGPPLSVLCSFYKQIVLVASQRA